MKNITLIFIFCCFYVCTGHPLTIHLEHVGTDPGQFLRKEIPIPIEGTIAQELILPMRLLSELDDDWEFKTGLSTKFNRRERRKAIRKEMIGLYTKDPQEFQKILLSYEFNRFYEKCVNGKVMINTGKTVDKLQKMSSKAKAEQLKELWPEQEYIYKAMSKAQKSKALLPEGPKVYKDDFTGPLHNKLKLPKLALMQSFLVRQEGKEIENRESKLYRLSSATSATAATANDIANLYQKGQVHCIDRLMSTSKPENKRTFLMDNEMKEDAIPANLQEMEIVITKPADTPCGVYIPHKSTSHKTYYQSEYDKNQREVLIPAGTCFKVTKKETSTGTTTNPNLKFKIEMTCLNK